MAFTKEQRNKWVMERYYKRRNFYLEKLGGKCLCCGSVEELEFDHIDRTTKSIKITSALSGYSDVKLEAEMAKCHLLCKPCHVAKTLLERNVTWTHGTSTTYRYHKCRCPMCNQWNRDQRRASRAKKKLSCV